MQISNATRLYSLIQLRFALLAFLFLSSITFSTAAPLDGQSSVESLFPTEGQKRTTKEIVQSLSTRHYRDQVVDDELSSRYLDKYLDYLDPGKSYFFASDIAEFEQYRHQFDDMLKKGDLDVGFEIFNRFRDRVVVRLEGIIARLESEDYVPDFTKDEQLPVDADEAEWAKDQESANLMWNKLIKSNLIGLILADDAADPSTAAQIDNDADRIQRPEKNSDDPADAVAIDPEAKFQAKIEEARLDLVKTYKTRLSRVLQRNATDVFESMMNSLALLYDPHTSYLAPRTLENFNISMSLSLEGIGAELTQDDEYTVVNDIVRGGPAYKQGELKRKDKIVAVGQGEEGELVDVVGWRLDEVVQLIRGPRDTVVRLKVISEKSGNANDIVRIVRNEVKLEDRAARKGVQTFTNGESLYKIGVIEVPAFYIDFEAYRQRDPDYRSTTRDVARLLDELEQENVDGIIIDLRDNGGGSLQEAEMLTDLFINPGPVVQIRQSDEKIYRASSRSRSMAKYRGPLMVLINRFSASASEIFAGAIQDYQRGLIVGGQSFGKGTVQSLTPVYEGQIKITESKFYRVSGDSTQHRGVLPDITYPDFIDTEEWGESSYENALPWDQIHPVPHAKYLDLGGIAPYLQQQHDKRVEYDPDFVYLVDQYEFNKERRNQKFVSLNINKRRAELAQRKQRQLDIENKRRIAKGLEPYKTYDEYEKKEEEIAEKRADEEYESNEILLDPGADPILNETALVMVDFIKLKSEDKVQRVANF